MKACVAFDPYSQDDPSVRKGVFCDLCNVHAHLQLSAIGTVFDVLFTNSTERLPPFRLQALLLLTRFAMEATRPNAYPSKLEIPADFETRGTFQRERMVELMQNRMAALQKWREEHPSAWKRLKSQFNHKGSGSLKAQYAPNGSHGNDAAALLSSSGWMPMLASLTGYLASVL